MRYLRYPAVAILTFVIGVIISPIHYFGESFACGGITEEGGGFSGGECFRSSYFIQVCEGSAVYRSPERANQVFDEKLQEAERVVEVAPKLDEDGVVVGRRAVAVFRGSPDSGRYVTIFWTHGRVLNGISSSSWMHVKHFERVNSKY
jgi:hypothetical protein